MCIYCDVYNCLILMKVISQLGKIIYIKLSVLVTRPPLRHLLSAGPMYDFLNLDTSIIAEKKKMKE